MMIYDDVEKKKIRFLDSQDETLKKIKDTVFVRYE